MATPLFYPDEEEEQSPAPGIGASGDPALNSAPATDIPEVTVKEEEEDEVMDDDDEGEDEILPEEDEEDALMEVDDDDAAANAYFKVGDRVPPFKSVYRPIREIYEMLKSKTLKLDPPYQRESVWRLPRRQQLIDSLFNGRPVMSLYFAVHSSDGVEYRNVIDGKQRLTTLNLFLSGRIPYRDKKTTSKKDFYWRRQQATPKTAFILPTAQKQFLQEVTIECIEYHELAMIQEEAIFKCIQQGVALTPAEKMRIGDEPGRTFIRELSETFSDNARTATHLNMKVNNGQDFSNLASFIYCIRYLPDERVHATKVKLETFLAEKRTFSDELQSRIRAALDDFWTIVRDHPNPFVIVKQKVAPIECIFILIFLSITRGFDLEARAKDILEMRTVVHDRYKGAVRSNPKVSDTLWREIDRVVFKYEITSDRLPEPLPPPVEIKKGPPKKRATKPRKKVVPSPTEVADAGSEDDALPAADANAGAAAIAEAMNSAHGDAGPSAVRHTGARTEASGAAAIADALNSTHLRGVPGPTTPGLKRARVEKTDESDDDELRLRTAQASWTKVQTPSSIVQQQERKRKKVDFARAGEASGMQR